MIGRKLLILASVIAVAAIGFAIGRMSGDSMAVPDQVRRVFPNLPPPPPKDDVSDDSNEQPDVLIEIPSEGSNVSGVFDVSGRFRNDGRILVIVLKDMDGKVIAESEAVMTATIGSEYGRFRGTVSLPSEIDDRVVIEMMSREEDGELSGPDAVRVVEVGVGEDVEVEVFFGNSRLDPESSCTMTFPVKRTVQGEGELYAAAIESMLSGPTAEEKMNGYRTSIPKGVSLLSIFVDDEGLATADFSSELDEGIAGSCMVTAIRSQITDTLTQFDSISEVVISVDGEVDEALQP